MSRDRHEEARLSAFRHAFAELFRDWNVTLPDGALRRDAAGELPCEGGSIQYRLHNDYGDQYLELFTMQGGTKERLYRIHADGRAELIAISFGDAAAPGARTEGEAHRFHHLVIDRGFHLPRR